jgi:hypothetical protein
MQKLKTFFVKNWAIIVILLVATFLRFYQLDNIPFGLFQDEAANGLDIIRIIEQGDHRVIYDTNMPRESLFFYFQAIFVWLGDNLSITALEYTPLALRIAPAIFGILTVWAIFLLGRELFNKNIGLLASATLAVSAWHIHFSRNGFRAIVLPFTLCFMFYFFIKAYREGKLKDYLWFAFFLALGFYTYLSIRMVPLIFIAFLIWAAFFNKEFIKNNLRKLAYSIGFFMFLMIPMFIHFYHVPADIFGRSYTSIFNPELNNGSALLTLGDNIVKEALMFNFVGDENFRHNVGGSPMLDIVTGLLFWVGVAISLVRFKRIEHFLLLTWFGAMSLPMILTADGIPNALRLVGAMPVIFIWIALGIDFVARKINNQKLRYVFVGIVLVVAGILGFKKYFIDFPTYTKAREMYAEDMVIMAYDLRKSQPDRINIMIVDDVPLKTAQYMVHAQKPIMRQYRVDQISENLVPDDSRFKIYLYKNWSRSAQRSLFEAGYRFNFQPVYSDLDGRILYYEYEG